MAQSTVDIQKMKSVSKELDTIYAAMIKQITKLDEHMSTLEGLWKGDAAAAYQTAYRQNTGNFLNLAEAINNGARTLETISNNYNRADNAAADAIKTQMGRR